MFQRCARYKLPQNLLIDTGGAGLRKADALAALRLQRANFVLQCAGVGVDIDLRITDRADAAHMARQVGDAKAPQPDDEKPHQHPHRTLGYALARHLGPLSARVETRVVAVVYALRRDGARPGPAHNAVMRPAKAPHIAAPCPRERRSMYPGSPR